jgi:hypothetical protein
MDLALLFSLSLLLLNDLPSYGSMWTAQFCCLMKLDQCEISGCCRGVVETFTVLVCFAAWVSWLPTFRENLPYASLRVKILTLENRTCILS